MLHVLAYHPLAAKIGLRAFWMPTSDDRVRGVAIVRVGGGAPPAWLAATGASLVQWRPERRPIPADHTARVESWSLA